MASEGEPFEPRTIEMGDHTAIHRPGLCEEDGVAAGRLPPERGPSGTFDGATVERCGGGDAIIVCEYGILERAEVRSLDARGFSLAR